MKSEIFSQADLMDRLVKNYVKNYCIMLDVPLNIQRIVIVASGSSHNAGLFGKYLFEEIANVGCNVEYASEFVVSKLTNLDKNALYLFLSQSGNSVDTSFAISKVKQMGIKTMCITNNDKSAIHDAADYKLYLDVGEECAIAATKTYLATVVMLWIVACKIAQNKHLDLNNELKNINTIKTNIESLFENIENIDVAAKIISKQKSLSITGYGINYPITCEAALKIKETSYINTNAYPMGEFIHGHFAVLNKSKILLAIMLNKPIENEIELIEKITRTYKVKSILISDEYDDYGCDILVKIPKANSRIEKIINYVVTIQILALKVALTLKRDVDNPKGLCKVVK